MSWNGWDTDGDDNVKVFPVTGWRVAALVKGMAGALRIEYANDSSLANPSALQVVVATPMVRELSQALANLADTLEADLEADTKGPAN